MSKILDLEEGDAHIIRNAGGVVTDDEIRSLAISQRLLGTSEIILIHHTDCGMLTFSDDDFRSDLQRETGVRPEWAAEAFSDLHEDLRQNIERIKLIPFIKSKTAFAGSSTTRDRQAARSHLTATHKTRLRPAERYRGAQSWRIELAGGSHRATRRSPSKRRARS